MTGIFTAEGRIGRVHFLMVSLVMFAIALVLQKYADLEDPSLLLIFPALALWWVAIVTTIKRLHDLDRTGWLCLVHFVPVLNLLFFLYLLVAPGTDGANDYG